MATKQAEAGLAINAKAITDAVTLVVQRDFGTMPEEIQQALIRDALECISDEMDHKINRTPINKMIENRLERLVDEGDKAGFRA